MEYVNGGKTALQLNQMIKFFLITHPSVSVDSRCFFPP